MANADGSVIIKTRVDVAQAEKDLAKLKGAVADTEEEIEGLTKERAEADRKSIFSAAELDAEKKKLSDMKKQLEEIRDVAKDATLSPSVKEEAKAQIPTQREEIAEQQARVRMLQTEYNRLSSSVERYDSRIKKATKKLERQQEEAGELAKKINSVSKASIKMAEAHEKAEKSMRKFGLRLREVVRSALVFTLITQALAKFRDWMSKVLKTNEEARQSFSRLKGALLTAAQPLVEILIPAAIALADALTKLLLVAAQITSALFGTTVEESKDAAESLNKETEALENVNSAADEAAKSMASFDEINQLTGETAESVTDLETIDPSFDFESENMVENADALAGAIAAIGAAFATWKISNAVLGWFDALGEGKFNNAGKVSVGIAGLAASFGLLTWHYDKMKSGEIDPNSLRSALVSVLETAIMAVSGASLFAATGVGFGVGILISLPIAAAVANFAIEMSDEQGQAAISNFKRIITGLFNGEDWGTVLGDLVSGVEKEKTIWEKISDMFTGTSLFNRVQDNLIGVFKNIGSEEYVKTLDMSIGQRIKYWMQNTFPGLFSDKTAEGKTKTLMENMMDNTFAPAGWWLGRKLGERIETWMRDSFPSFFGEKDAEEKTAKSIFTMLFNAASPLEKWLIVLLQDPVSAFLKGGFNAEWGNAWATIGDTMKQKIVDALNWVIQKVNSVTGWINGVFGTNIGKISEIQIPASGVANGTSMPRGTSSSLDYSSLVGKFFPTGVLDGGKHQASGGVTETTVVLELDKREFGRAVYRVNLDESARVGLSLIK